jgi:hypothetical protein
MDSKTFSKPAPVLICVTVPATYQFVVSVADLNLPCDRNVQVPAEVECCLQDIEGNTFATFPLRLYVGQNDRCRQGVRSTSEVCYCLLASTAF